MIITANEEFSKHQVANQNQGFGFKANCSIENITWSYPLGGFAVTMFDTSVDLYRIDDSDIMETRTYVAGIQLNATFSDGPDSFMDSDGEEIRGRLTSHVCTLQAGIVAYKVTVNGATVSLLSNRSEDEFLTPITLRSPSTRGGYSTIGGFQYAGDVLFSSTATLNFGGAVSSMVLEGSLANQHLANSSASEYDQSFTDPMPVMLDALRDIAFRASVRAAKDNGSLPDAAQEVPYTGTDERTVYVTDRRYLATAAVISLVSVAAVAATLWGWWELGREVSASPLEIAKAFNAPLLDGMGSNVPWNKIPKQVAREKIQYGERVERGGRRSSFRDLGRPGQLIFERDGDVKKPTVGGLYGE
ncbi:MAG: hypothetical protein Q9204_007662 [Flavoplaca sp. TL-2023a]